MKLNQDKSEVFCKKSVIRNSCEFCDVYKNTFSYRTPPVAAFDKFHLMIADHRFQAV